MLLRRTASARLRNSTRALRSTRIGGLRALSSAPLLPRWGSFGKDASQIDGFIETVREEGAQHVKLTRELAERGLRLYMMLTRPHLWFSDAEWRKGWLEQASEPMDRYARINYELMEGCEFAYRALAEEFCRAEPDFEAFVESGALDPELASYLAEAVAKHHAAGRRPTLDVSRVSGEVLLLDSLSGRTEGFVATVVFRSREEHAWEPLGAAKAAEPAAAAAEGAAAEGAPDVDGSVAAAEAAMAAAEEPPPSRTPSIQFSHGAAAEGAAADGGAAGGAAAAGEFEEHAQVWTFHADHPSVPSYLNWLTGTMNTNGDGASGHDDRESPVRWRLRDINFVVHGYEATELPETAEELMSSHIRAVASLAGTIVLFGVLGYQIYAAKTAQRGVPPPTPGLGGERQRQMQMQQRREREPPAPREVGGRHGGGGDPWAQELATMDPSQAEHPPQRWQR